MPANTALIFGVSGLVGRNLAEHLSAKGGWKVIGVSRRKHGDIKLKGVELITADLNKPAAAMKALAQAKKATHVFFSTWSRQATETENCRVNGGMFRAAIEGAAANAKIRHVALVTGLKHYLGSFENYGATQLDTPFTEDQPRVPGENFYYTQEDILFELAGKNGFTWSVARPHTIIGFSPDAAMNLGTSLAVYATLCKETGRPFVFPGSPESWDGLVDMTDARVLAAHLEWEATTRKAADKAFNVVNGDYFRWRKMWKSIAAYFEIEPAPYPGRESPLATSLADVGADWDGVIKKYKLRKMPIDRVAPWWHVDADLGRTQECVTDMSRSRGLGFLRYQRTADSFAALFDRLRAERIIP
ncbi:MAG: SDR family oxidoreductase [Bauldia sp.]